MYGALGHKFGDASLIDDCHIPVSILAYPEDGFSIAWALPGAEGSYVNATHGGVTLAPVLGSLMAEVVVEGRVPEMLAPFGMDAPGGGVWVGLRVRIDSRIY